MSDTKDISKLGHLVTEDNLDMKYYEPRSKVFNRWIMAFSPPGLFAPGSFAPWLVCPLADSPPVPGWFTLWLVRPMAFSSPHLGRFMTEWISQAQGANKPGSERTRGWTRQTANKPGSKRAGGESARGWTSQGTNKPWGEQARGRTGKEAKKPDTQQIMNNSEECRLSVKLLSTKAFEFGRKTKWIFGHWSSLKL